MGHSSDSGSDLIGKGDDDRASDISIDRVFRPGEKRIEGVDGAEVVDTTMREGSAPKKRKTLTRESIRAAKS